MSDACELYANRTWHRISIDEALTSYAERDLRCQEFWGDLQALAQGQRTVGH